MTRDEKLGATQMPDQEAAAMKVWEKPSFQRFSAGSAEDGAAAIVDGGAFPS